MNFEHISGKRAFDILKKFDYTRTAGSTEEKCAAWTLCELLDDIGLKANIQSFEFLSRDVNSARLIVTKPYKKEYTVAGYLNSYDTPDEGITSELVYVEEGDDINLSKASGKIALICHEVRAADYERMQKAGIIGFISVTGSPLDMGGDLTSTEFQMRHIENPKLTGLNLHYNMARELIERGASEATIILRQDERIIESQNVYVRIPGARYPADVIALSAHYDSVSVGKGAYDNMSGVMIVLEVCRYFAKHQPDKTLEFIFFGAEERGLRGSLEFLKKTSEELKCYRINLNVDLAGQAVGGTVLGVTAGGDVCDMLDKLLWQCGIGAIIKKKVWASDSNAFAFKGIPAVTLDRDGFGMHTQYDTIELISPWALERDARLLAFITNSIDKMDKLPFKRRIPEAMKRELEKYFRE